MPKTQAQVAVVDNDPSFLAAVRNVLDAADIATKGFSSASQFLQSILVEQFDCLIVDVDLGEISGLDLQRQLKTIEPTLPIIIMTGRTSDLILQIASTNGCIDFLRKPFVADRLVAAVHRSGSVGASTINR